MGTTKKLDISREAKKERLEAFCREYVVDFNGTRAVEAAGYSKKGAAPLASKLLTNTNIQKRIAQLVEKKFQRVDLRADKVLMDIKNLAESDLQQIFAHDESLKHVSKWPKAIALAVSSFEVEEERTTRLIYDEDDPDSDVAIGEETVVVKIKKVKFWDKTKALEMLGKNLKLFHDNFQGNLTQINVQVTEAQLTAITKKLLNDY